MVNRVVGTHRWRRWMPWWAGTYFVAAFAVASLTSEATVDGDGASTLFWLVQLPIALVAAWYCFRRARHCRAQAAVALGLGGAVYLSALQPAITEEVTFRLFPLAWWIAARGALPTTRRGRTGLYAWLVLPWAATHVPDLVVTNPLEALYVVLLLIVVFGIPLAWLTARRGVQSAITAHWAVDAIAMGLS